VITVTTVDRVEFRPWPPSSAAAPAVGPHAATDEELYVGKHRKPGLRRLAMLALFYSAKHRRRD
jgi:hypothetical protein